MYLAKIILTACLAVTMGIIVVEGQNGVSKSAVPSVPAAIDEPKEILLWPGGAPGSEGKTAPEKVRIAEGGDHVISSIHHPSITPYLPAAAEATGAAVIIAPGGGHSELWIDHEGYNPAKWLRAHGIAAFVLKYRLARETGSTYTIDGEELADMQRAIRMVRSRAGEWGIDTSRIGVMGFSAGGELAALSAMRFDEGHAEAADPIDRQRSRPDFQALIYPGGSSRFEAVKDAPPLFLAGGYKDRPDISEGLAQVYLKYKQAGIPAELHIYAGVGHGFGIRPTNTGAVAGWISRFDEWLGDMGFLGSRKVTAGVGHKIDEAGHRPGISSGVSKPRVNLGKTMDGLGNQAESGGPVAGAPWDLSLPGHAMLGMVWIKPGIFMMGSPSSETGRKPDEGPETEVTLSKGYWLGKTEVTIGQWRAVTGHSLRDQVMNMLNDDNVYDFGGQKELLRDFMHFDRNDPDKIMANEGDSLPMYFVSWNDAVEYCKKLTLVERAAGRLPEGYEYNLPTEAQWEFACRAGTKDATFQGPLVVDGGQATVLEKTAWYGANSANGYTGKRLGKNAAGPRNAGEKEANAWGLQDMYGNLWEWCRDWYGPYPGGKVVDPTGPAMGTGRVNRGGSWGSGAADERSANRAKNPQPEKSAWRGFRIALCPI
jgi:formylglycine-generating enzyme required for sulfatase activity/acetyl esterase/lipase